MGKRRGRKKGNGSGGIPDALVLFMLSNGEFVVFPSRDFVTMTMVSVPDPKTNPFIQALKESRYIVCQPFVDDNDLPEVGVVGEMADFEEKKEGGVYQISFKFRGLFRAFCQFDEEESEGNIFKVRWSKMNEVPIFPYEIQSSEFAEELETFKGLYQEFSFSGVVNEKMKDDEEALGHASTADELAEKAEAETLSEAIDAVLMVLNHFGDLFGGFGLLLYKMFLRETRVFTRLKQVNQLLSVFNNYISALKNEDDKDGKLPEEEEEIEILDENEEESYSESNESWPTESPFPEIPESFAKGSILSVPPEGKWTELDPEKRSLLFQKGLEFFKSRMVSQEPAIEQILKTLVLVRAGFSDPDKPKVVGIFCGPTGVGKTESVKILAEFLFGDPNGYVHIAGNELLSPYSISRLTGAEPGFVGFGLGLKQWNLDKAHVLKILRLKYKNSPEALRKILAQVSKLEGELTGYNYDRRSSASLDNVKEQMSKITGWRPGGHLSLLLIDELDKVHQNVQRVLLRILDDGILDLANGERSILKNTLVVFTSNIFGRQIADKISGRRRIGIHPDSEESVEEYRKLTQEIYQETLRAAEEFLLPELLGRIGKEKIRVLHPFSAENLKELIERIRLPALVRSFKKKGIALYVSDALIVFLQKEVFDTANRALGARAVESVIMRRITEELANLFSLGDEGIKAGDAVLADIKEKEDESGQKIIIKKLVKRSS